jgi:outer membrane lipoprotein SlyB
MITFIKNFYENPGKTQISSKQVTAGDSKIYDNYANSNLMKKKYISFKCWLWETVEKVIKTASGSKKNIFALISLLFFGAITITGCAQSNSGQVYSSKEARKVQTVETGTIESVKQVTIQGDQTPLGVIAGGVAGGVLGSAVGDGHGKDIATVVGAIAGAAAGNAVEKGVNRKNGLELVIKKDTGGTIVIVQEADVLFSPGDRVRIISSPYGETRVSK